MSKIFKFKGILHKVIHTHGIAYVTLGNFISSILGALFWLILARIIIVEYYGYINYILSLAALAGAFSILGLNITVTTYLPKGEDLTHEAVWIVFIASLMVSTIFVFLRLFYVAILAITGSAFKMFLFETLGRKQYKKWMILSIGYRIGQLVSSLSLYQILGINGILVGYIVPPLFLCLPFFARLTIRNLNFSTIKSKLNFSLHAYSVTLTNIFIMYFDKILIGWIFGLTILGLYQLGYQFFWALSIIPTSLFQFLLPEKASGSSSREIEFVGISIAILLALVAILFSPIAIYWFFPHFIESVVLTQIMCLAVIPATIANIESATFYGNEKSIIVFKSNIIALIVEIVGLYILATFLGVIGLSIAIVSSQIALAVCLRLFKNK